MNAMNLYQLYNCNMKIFATVKLAKSFLSMISATHIRSWHKWNFGQYCIDLITQFPIKEIKPQEL